MDEDREDLLLVLAQGAYETLKSLAYDRIGKQREL